MKKSIQVILEEPGSIELMRILLDEDAGGALTFLRTHFKGKARELLEGGCKAQINIPGTGDVQEIGNLLRK